MSDPSMEYVTNYLNPFLKEIVASLLLKKPDEPTKFLLDMVEKRLGIEGQLSEKAELHKLRQEVALIKSQNEYGSEDERTDSEEEEDAVEEMLNIVSNPDRHRSAVSAESYGNYNKKEDFVPRQIPKTNEQEDKLKDRLSKSFMFSHLQGTEKSIVVQAMEEKKVKNGEIVIKEGDGGNELYIVESGTLKCYKKIANEDKEIKQYQAGEAFGELALLYNAPRAATIIAEGDCTLWSLDRECFNHIVKDAAVKRREKYVEFLSRIEILSNMDPYERSQLADVLKSESFSEGEFIIKQGEEGNVFFIIEEGNAIATKILHEGHQPEEVMKYGPGDYFGELALMKNEPRAANVQAITELKSLTLDRHSFKRLLGPLDDILRRNAKNYEEIIAKKVG
jgi:cAMP-dependent protein kinase regulator